ncbi:hypothetical protein NMG60_11018211 [Bertholletia excelsa]
MACWSAENATRAYLRTMNMGHRVKEPDVAEFISALAAGNNAQLMVVVCATGAAATTQALAAAAHQTGGHVVCILPGLEQVQSLKRALGLDSRHVEFVIGDARSLLTNDYREADFVIIDCNLDKHGDIFRAVQARERGKNGTIVLGYNAYSKESWSWGGSETQLLPIGEEGLLLTRMVAKAKLSGGGSFRRRGYWVVEVDKCTGEEHVFRVRSPQRRVIEA